MFDITSHHQWEVYTCSRDYNAKSTWASLIWCCFVGLRWTFVRFYYEKWHVLAIFITLKTFIFKMRYFNALCVMQGCVQIEHLFFICWKSKKLLSLGKSFLILMNYNLILFVFVHYYVKHMIMLYVFRIWMLNFWGMCL